MEKFKTLNARLDPFFFTISHNFHDREIWVFSCTKWAFFKSDNSRYQLARVSVECPSFGWKNRVSCILSHSSFSLRRSTAKSFSALETSFLGGNGTIFGEDIKQTKRFLG